MVLDLGVAEEARNVIPLTPEEAEKIRAKYPPVGVVPIKGNRLKVLRSDVPKEVNSSNLKKMGKVDLFIYTKKMRDIQSRDGFKLQWLFKKNVNEKALKAVAKDLQTNLEKKMTHPY